MKSTGDTLVLGWGNPGRGDDGLGPEFVRLVAGLGLPGIATDSDYQLQVEDAAEVARYQRVLFVDADRSGGAPFWVERLLPDRCGLSFSTHSVSPGAVLALVRDLFRAEPEAWILGIRGYNFDEFDESLSTGARSNLDQAVDYLKSTVLRGGLVEIRPPAVIESNRTVLEGELCQTTNP